MEEPSENLTENSGCTAVNVSSPCVGVCALDERDLCIACHRSGIEIAEWGVMSNDEKKAVLQRVRQREAASFI
jgi:hypothetical protein